jgi:hypothetical protein
MAMINGIRLNLRTEPAWIEIANGAAMLTKAPSTTLVMSARAKAEALLDQIMGGAGAIHLTGATITDLPDLDDELAVAGLKDALFVCSLAELSVIDWRNIYSAEGTEVVFDEALIPTLMEDARIAEVFLRRYLDPLDLAVTEGNA